jgi:UDP-glucose 4-epimerase
MSLQGPNRVMKVLITGASGFIGGALATHFKAQGAQVFVDVAERSSAGRVTLSPALLAQAMQGAVPDAIVHAAGSGTVAQVAADPVSHMANNLAATLAVLEFARAQPTPVRVVLLSSAAVYGNAPATPQRESDAREPVSLYGVSKLQAEQLLAHYAHQSGLACTAVRLFSVYGPGLRKQLLWDAMNKFAAGKCEFFGTGQELRDWVHVDDVCFFVAKLLAQPAGAAFEVFNCAGQAASTKQVLSGLATQAGAPLPQFNGVTRVGDPPCLVADCNKAAQRLGWQAEVDWREGMTGFARWFAAQRQSGTVR